MFSVFLIHIASLISLPALSDSRSITFAYSQSITWFLLQTWSVIADLLQILAALVFSAVVKIPVMISTSLQYSFTLAPSDLPVSPTDEGFWHEAETLINSMLFGCFRVIKYTCSRQPDETFHRTSWHCFKFIKWTEWTLAVTLSQWQHHEHCLRYHHHHHHDNYCNTAKFWKKPQYSFTRGNMQALCRFCEHCSVMSKQALFT